MNKKTPREGGTTNCSGCGAEIPQGALCADCWHKRAFPDDYKPSKLYWYEALDRSHVACDHFYEYVQKHPAVEHDAELTEAAEKVVDAMQGFYQLVGSKCHEFAEEDKMADDISAVLFDGYAVYQNLSHTGRQRVSPEGVADVLDAVVGLLQDDG